MTGIDDTLDLESMAPEEVDAWVTGVVDGVTGVSRILPERQAEFEQVVARLVAHLERRGASPEMLQAFRDEVARLYGDAGERPMGA